MAVENPVMQRMLSERRAALGLPVRDPQESDPTRQQSSNPTDYFEDILSGRSLQFGSDLEGSLRDVALGRSSRATSLCRSGHVAPGDGGASDLAVSLRSSRSEMCVTATSCSRSGKSLQAVLVQRSL
ncbi:hypothetical protein YC2023_059221 [Brassica napus]